jgi:3-isopropylmalate/(R)-2-methylmalate dehydratase large subunit
VLATQCLLQRRPKTLAIEVQGRLRDAVTAKDVILAIIGKIGVAGGTGHVIEYRGSAIEALLDGRAHDRVQHVDRRRRTRRNDRTRRDDVRVSQRAVRLRRRAKRGTAQSSVGASCEPTPVRAYDRVVEIDANELEPMISYGTNPGMVVPITAAVPDHPGDAIHAKSLAYMGLNGGEPLLGKPVQVVFVGSCTNARLSDLEQPHASCAVARSQAEFACSSCPARSRSNAKLKPAAWPRCSPTPARSGENPAARCASA